MTETQFLECVDETMVAIERSIDAAGVDIETTRSSNVLTLELANGSKVVVNSQAPMQQLWVAGKSGAFHYAWREGAWRDTRDGSELFAALSRLVSAQGGEPVVFGSR
jgi:CyaY protein